MLWWSSIFLGAVVAIGVSVVLLLLGTGLGLSFFPMEQLEATRAEILGLTMGSALYLVLCLAAAAFVGGFMATRSMDASRMDGSRAQAVFQGAGMWGLVLTVEMLLTGLVFAPALTSAAGYSGVGVGAIAFWEELRKANPRIVSDLEVTKGKVITSLVMDSKATLPNLVATAEKNARSVIAQDKPLKAARQATAGLALLGFFASFVSLAGSILGAYAGANRSLPAGRSMDRREPPLSRVS